MITFGLFKDVHDFIWHSLSPFFSYVRPPHSEMVSDGDRYISHILVLTLIFLFGFFVEPLGRSSV